MDILAFKLFYSSLLITSLSTHDLLQNVFKAGCHYNKTTADLDADFILGAVFPIQKISNWGYYVYSLEGMPWVEAFLYTLEKINNNTELLPGVQLGFDVRNSCNNLEVALEHSVDFITNTRYVRPQINSSFTGSVRPETNSSNEIGSFSRSQRPNDNEGFCTCVQGKKSLLAAVIGAKSNQLSMTMSDLLGTDYIPLVSYASSSPQFSSKKVARSFLRTIPSDLLQTNAIVDLLAMFDWVFPLVVVADDAFGRDAFLSLSTKMKSKGMCMAAGILYDIQQHERSLREIVSSLRKERRKTSVVVLWSEYEVAKQIIEHVSNNGFSDLTWIGPEAWAANLEILRGKIMPQRFTDLSRMTNSIISIRRTEVAVKTFDKFFKSITYKSHLPNVWFPGFWAWLGMKPEQNPSASILSTQNIYNVIAAVYAVGHGLHNYLNCTSSTCHGDLNKPIDYEELWHSIRNVSFIVPNTTDRIEFNKFGDVSTVSFKYSTWAEGSNRKVYKLVDFGSWTGLKETTSANYTELKQLSLNITPVAVCSQPCQAGYSTIIGQRQCCWECAICKQDTISTDGLQCTQCPRMSISDATHTKCTALANITLSAESLSGKLLLMISIVGMACVLIVLGVFIKHWNTPLVKASSREMSSLQLLGMLLLFFLPLFHILVLTPSVCAAQISWFGILYAYIVSFIVIKTYRLLLVFKKKRMTKISRFLRTSYQIVLSLLLVLIQSIGILGWFFNFPPKLNSSINRDDVTFVYFCGEKEDILLYYNIGFVFLLSLTCGWMAFRARKLPANFNEAQFITFAMFTTCLAWLVFAVLYSSSDRNQKPIVFLGIVLVNNFCLLFIMYGNKVYIMLVKPKLNTKEHFLKLSENATIVTFATEAGHNIPPQARPSVITFDFDTMFDDYRRQKEQTNTMPVRSRVKTLRKNISFYFPKASVISRRTSKKRKTKKKRPKTMLVHHQVRKHKVLPNRSVSLNDLQNYLEIYHNPELVINGRFKKESLAEKLTSKKPSLKKSSADLSPHLDSDRYVCMNIPKVSSQASLISILTETNETYL